MESKIKIDKENGEYHIKVEGRALVLECDPFWDFVKSLEGDDYKAISIDLSGCTAMDCTFTGILVNMGLKANGKGFKVSVVNADEKSKKHMEEMGLNEIFNFKDLSGEKIIKNQLNSRISPGNSINPVIRIEHGWTVFDVEIDKDLSLDLAGRLVHKYYSYEKGISIERKDGKRHWYPQTDTHPDIFNLLGLCADKGTTLTIKVEGNYEEAIVLVIGLLHFLRPEKCLKD